ncbi:MAG: hypothetical protein ACTSU5_16505 [Promethearchaeota archaeon]
MSFGKAFGAAIGLLLGASFGLGLLYQLVGLQTDISTLFSGDSMLANIMGLLLTPSISAPSAALLTPVMTLLAGGSDTIGTLLLLVYLFIPGLIAALLAGKLGESVGAGFGSVFMAFLIGAVLYMIFWNFMVPEATRQTFETMLQTLFGSSGTVLMYTYPLIVGLVNGIFYGGIAAVMAGREGF